MRRPDELIDNFMKAYGKSSPMDLGQSSSRKNVNNNNCDTATDVFNHLSSSLKTGNSYCSPQKMNSHEKYTSFTKHLIATETPEALRRSEEDNRKENLMLLLLHSVCSTYDPSPSFYFGLCQKLMENGYLSTDKFNDLDYLKQLSHDLLLEAIHTWPATKNSTKVDSSKSVPLKRTMSLDSILRNGMAPEDPKGATNSTGGEGHGVEIPYTSLPLFNFFFYTRSRYKQDFRQLQRIGRGGFGEVYRAQHRVDGQEYAIKRVKFSFKNIQELNDTYQQVTKEVKTIAGLDHPNIVRYNQAWFEPVNIDEPHSHNSSYDHTDDRFGDLVVGGGGGAGGALTFATTATTTASVVPKAQSQQMKAKKNGYVGNSNKNHRFRIGHQASKNDYQLDGDDDGDDDDDYTLDEDDEVAAGNNSSNDDLFQFDDSLLTNANVNAFGNSKGLSSSNVMLGIERLPQVETPVSNLNISTNSVKIKQQESHITFKSDDASDTFSPLEENKRTGLFERVQNCNNKQLMKSPRSIMPQNNNRTVQNAVDDKKNSQGLSMREMLSEIYSMKRKRFEVALYIQMQLCMPTTLEEWLWSEDRVKYGKLDLPELYHYLKQLLNGMALLHAKKVIHRDLKPSNLFINQDKVLKIGDFGLATFLESNNNHPFVDPQSESAFENNNMFVFDTSCSSGNSKRDLTSGIGTPTYGAPEQLSNTNYSEKSDIFSLGIIMFEMFHPFSTKTERAKILKDLRRGKIPQDIENKFPKQMELIRKMVALRADGRPSVEDVLSQLAFIMDDKDEIIRQQQKIISNLQQKNRELEALVASLKSQ